MTPFSPSFHCSGIYWAAAVFFPAARLLKDKSVSVNIRGLSNRRAARGMRFYLFCRFSLFTAAAFTVRVGVTGVFCRTLRPPLCGRPTRAELNQQQTVGTLTLMLTSPRQTARRRPSHAPRPCRACGNWRCGRTVS